MGYIFLEQKLWVPLEFLERFLKNGWQKQLHCIRSLVPLRWEHHNVSLFQLEWDLGGTIEWGADWGRRLSKSPLSDRAVCQFSIANKGLMECGALSAEESKIRVKLSYEVLEDDTLWQAFMKVFSTPAQQIDEDLHWVKEAVEKAYIDSLLEVFIPPHSKNCKPRVVPAA